MQLHKSLPRLKGQYQPITKNKFDVPRLHPFGHSSLFSAKCVNLYHIESVAAAVSSLLGVGELEACQGVDLSSEALPAWPSPMPPSSW